MEMERINENTVLIKIANHDLQERGITLMDLFADPGQVEQFFHSILDEFEMSDQFVDSGAVTFQVMPHSDGLELYITKTEMDEEAYVVDEDVMKRLLESLQATVSHKQQTKKSAKPSKVKLIKNDTETDELNPVTKLEATIAFESIEDFFQLAKYYTVDVQEATLYSYYNKFYLHIYDEVTSAEDLSLDYAYFYEYGEPSKVSVDVLSEYGKVVMPHNAIAFAATHFK